MCMKRPETSPALRSVSPAHTDRLPGVRLINPDREHLANRWGSTFSKRRGLCTTNCRLHSCERALIAAETFQGIARRDTSLRKAAHLNFTFLLERSYQFGRPG